MIYFHSAKTTIYDLISSLTYLPTLPTYLPTYKPRLEKLKKN